MFCQLRAPAEIATAELDLIQWSMVDRHLKICHLYI